MSDLRKYDVVVQKQTQVIAHQAEQIASLNNELIELKKQRQNLFDYCPLVYLTTDTRYIIQSVNLQGCFFLQTKN